MQVFDVAIIGAGPAGSAAAISLARRGYSVALFDKQQFPREKICGDFLNPANWQIYRELGVDNAILSEPHEKISSLRITAPSGANVVAPISQDNDTVFGLGISRERLDSVLLQAAMGQGVTILQKRRVKKLSRQAGAWRIDAEHENDIQSARAKILIGADGRNSWVAHQLGFSGRGAAGGNAIGFQFRLRSIDPDRSRVEIHVFPGGYAGLANLGDGTANLCLAVARDRVPLTRPIDGPLSLGGGRNPFLRELMSRAEFFPEVRSSFPVYFPPRRSYAEGALLVGDAAQVVEPVTGEGVYFAGRSGLIAAASVDEAFQRGDFSALHLSSYERRCRREFRRRRALNRLIQYLIYRSSLGESLIKFSSKRSRLLHAIVKSICAPQQMGYPATA